MLDRLRGLRLLVLMPAAGARHLQRRRQSRQRRQTQSLHIQEFGVAVATGDDLRSSRPRGGGRYPPEPYTVRGVSYQPVDPGYVATGGASWYGQGLPWSADCQWRDLRCVLSDRGEPGVAGAIPRTRVTNLGMALMVRINDRGTLHAGPHRRCELRNGAGAGFANSGSAQVELRYGPAPAEMATTIAMLMASLNTTTRMEDQGRRARCAGRHRQCRATAIHIGRAGRDIIGLFDMPRRRPAGRNSAVDAAAAMATRATALDDWRNAVDDNAQDRYLLGVPTDQVAAISISSSSRCWQP